MTTRFEAVRPSSFAFQHRQAHSTMLGGFHRNLGENPLPCHSHKMIFTFEIQIRMYKCTFDKIESWIQACHTIWYVTWNIMKHWMGEYQTSIIQAQEEKCRLIQCIAGFLKKWYGAYTYPHQSCPWQLAGTCLSWTICQDTVTCCPSKTSSSNFFTLCFKQETCTKPSRVAPISTKRP